MFTLITDTTLEDLGAGVSRRILAHGGKMMAVQVNFEKGAVGPLHSHPHEQLTYVLSGEFEFTIGEEVRTVKAGDTLYKEPHVMHGCVCRVAGTLLDTFTPIREDFLRQP
jgi:quercetin dioxygenase-like cupin family protein